MGKSVIVFILLIKYLYVYAKYFIENKDMQPYFLDNLIYLNYGGRANIS
jgi:hypothetical protein